VQKRVRENARAAGTIDTKVDRRNRPPSGASVAGRRTTHSVFGGDEDDPVLDDELSKAVATFPEDDGAYEWEQTMSIFFWFFFHAHLSHRKKN
jgi:hypothetical protein